MEIHAGLGLPHRYAGWQCPQLLCQQTQPTSNEGLKSIGLPASDWLALHSSMSVTDEVAEIEETMTEIRRNWNFNPIMVALDMLQSGGTNGGAHDYESFLRLHDKLEQSMAFIIDKYYTGFNDAVGIFGGIDDSMNASKDIVKKVKSDAEGIKEQIQYKRNELPEVWSKVQHYKNAMAASEKLEKLQRGQALSTQFANRKFFIPAARALMDSLYDARYLQKTVNTADLMEVLEASRVILFDQIVEEIESLIFLKDIKSARQLFSRLCETIPDARNLLVGSLSQATEIRVDIGEADLVLDPKEFDFDPTSHAVAYLASLVKACAIIERLPNLLTAIAQKIVPNVYQIVDRSIQSTAIKYRTSGNGLTAPNEFQLMNFTSSGGFSEFSAAASHVRCLAERICGEFLTVAHGIRMIGDTVKIVLEDSKIEFIDLTSFYRNCLSAIHAEFKNFLSCFLHGSGNASRVFSNSSLAISEILKRGTNSSLGATNRSPLYQFINVAPSDDLGYLMEPSEVLATKEEMNARKLAAMSVSDPFSPNIYESNHAAFVKPDIQYLSVFYQVSVRLDQWLSIIFPQEQQSSEFIDAVFLAGTLEKEYMPALESALVQEISKLFNPNETERWESVLDSDPTVPIGKQSGVILESFHTFITIFFRLQLILHKLPSAQGPLEQLTSKIMDLFLDKCNVRYRELVTSKGGEESSKSFVAASSLFVENPELRSLLSQHSMFSAVEDEAMDIILAKKESILMENLKGDRSLHRSEVIFDYRVLRSICLLQRSAELTLNIISSSSFGSLPAFAQARPEMRPNALKDGRITSFLFDGTQQSTVDMAADFETSFTRFSVALENLAKSCLLLLRCEVRIHCFYFLDLAFREGDYQLEQPATVPDHYVANLAGDLLRFDALVSNWLPYSRYHVVMDELSESLAVILINNFVYIRGLDELGCRKLVLNVASLEQAISSITSGGYPASFDRVKDFYTLASYGSKFIEMAPRMRYKYTMAQYQSIFDVYYHDLSGDTELRKTYMNQLVRLKYFIEA